MINEYDPNYYIISSLDVVTAWGVAIIFMGVMFMIIPLF